MLIGAKKAMALHGLMLKLEAKLTLNRADTGCVTMFHGGCGF